MGASNGLFGSKQKPQPCQPGLRVRWRCKGANQNSARHFKEIAGLLLFYIGLTENSVRTARERVGFLVVF